VMLLVRKEAVGRPFHELDRHVADGLRKAKML
jgi:hypothetical protein